MNNLTTLITECSICRDWKVKGKEYYTPKPEERRTYYLSGQHLSHGFCNECYIAFEKKELLEVKDGN